MNVDPPPGFYRSRYTRQTDDRDFTDQSPLLVLARTGLQMVHPRKVQQCLTFSTLERLAANQAECADDALLLYRQQESHLFQLWQRLSEPSFVGSEQT